MAFLTRIRRHARKKKKEQERKLPADERPYLQEF